MKSTAIVCAIAAASLGFGSLSFAQGYDGRGPRGEPPRIEHRGPVHVPAHRAGIAMPATTVISTATAGSFTAAAASPPSTAAGNMW